MRVVNGTKDTLVMHVLECVCLTVPCRMPTLLHWPGFKLGKWYGVPPSCALLGRFAVHGFRCYDNTVRTRNVSECLYSLYACFFLFMILCTRSSWQSVSFSAHDQHFLLHHTWCFNTYFSSRTLSFLPPIPTIILQPLYRTTCVIRHRQLRTGWFCWSKVLLPDNLWQPASRARNWRIFLQQSYYCPHALADSN